MTKFVSGATLPFVVPRATKFIRSSSVIEHALASAQRQSGAGALESALNRFSQKNDSDSEADSELEGADIRADDLGPFSHEDESAFNAFMPEGSTQGGKLLSNLTGAKLKQTAPESGEGGMDGDTMVPEEVASEDMERIYEDVGKLLSRCAASWLRKFVNVRVSKQSISIYGDASLGNRREREHWRECSAGCRYTAGKLPKAFKVIPHLKNWEEVLFMTSPQTWSPHATLCATKMFVSQLNAKQVQRFLNLILLNKVRDDIRENKRLHFALFQAVKKAVFKAGAFYKGFLLPLLKEGDCTLREAVILSAVLNRVSVPMDHSAAVCSSNVPHASHMPAFCMHLHTCRTYYTSRLYRHAHLKLSLDTYCFESGLDECCGYLQLKPSQITHRLPKRQMQSHAILQESSKRSPRATAATQSGSCGLHCCC